MLDGVLVIASVALLLYGLCRVWPYLNNNVLRVPLLAAIAFLLVAALSA